MKLSLLEVEGFGPFKNKQIVDFSMFDHDGIFLIEGQTGAGKSSILDAITYALYDFTARWMDSKANSEFKSVRSHFCTPEDHTRVQLDFVLNVGEIPHTYRVIRSIPGVKKDGTEKPTVAQLFELNSDGTQQGVASGVSAVAAEISKLVRLDKTEFLQVVLLAQGRFQAFLEATSEQRLELLRKLFNTRRFAEIQTALTERANQIERALEADGRDLNSLIKTLASSLGTDEPQTGEEMSWLLALLHNAKDEFEQANNLASQAKVLSDAAAKRVDQAALQEELRLLALEKIALQAKGPAHEENKGKLKQAQRAANIKSFFDVLMTAEQELLRARNNLAQLELDKEWPKLSSDFDAKIQEQDQLIGALDTLVADEANLFRLKGELQTCRDELQELQASLDEISVQLKVLGEEREQINSTPMEPDKLQAESDDLELFESLRSQLNAAEIEVDAARKNLLQAAEFQERLTRDYRAHLASSLAADLKPGVACQVCGSLDHPSKAQSFEWTATEADLEFANTARSEASSHYGSALANLERISEQIGPMLPRFASLSEVAFEALKKKTKEAIALAETRAERLRALQSLLDPEGELHKEFQKFRELKIQKESSIKAIAETVDSLAQRVSSNLEGWPTVKERTDAIKQLRLRLEAAKKALYAVESSSKSEHSARTTFIGKLGKEGFSSSEEFESCFLESAELEQLVNVVTEFDDREKQLSIKLADSKFKDLPPTTIDLVEAQEQLEGAEGRRTEAERNVGAVEERLKQIDATRGRVEELLPQIANLASSLKVHRGLANLVNGKEPNELRMSLETYFAAAELELVFEAANRQLKLMAAGTQYTLQHSDKALRGSGKSGLGIEVLDEFTGRERQPESLSGGEKFQISLAIALGLAEVVSERSGAIRIDTLFVDEGFGSLSSEVLETAMRAMDNLKQGGRTIGLISHVEKMQEEISAKLIVEKTPRGPSTIRQA